MPRLIFYSWRNRWHRYRLKRAMAALITEMRRSNEISERRAQLTRELAECLNSEIVGHGHVGPDDHGESIARY